MKHYFITFFILCFTILFLSSYQNIERFSSYPIPHIKPKKMISIQNYNYEMEKRKNIIDDFYKQKPLPPSTIEKNINTYYFWKFNQTKEPIFISLKKINTEQLHKILKQLPDKWDMIVVDAKITDKHKNRVYQLKNLKSYIIHKKGIQNIFKHLPIQGTIEEWLSQHSNDIFIFNYPFTY